MILTKLSINTPCLGVAPKYPIGINSRVQEVLKVLDVKSNGVEVVGFHGMGGIVGRGITMIKERIRDKRVLVVLDEVDDVSQLDALAGDKDWYHEGSRIIIITRDNKLLTEDLVTKIYEVKELDSTESLQLFSYHAFGRDKPIKTFLHLSKQVVSLTGRIPLALEVLGEFFYDKRIIKVWEDGLGKLKQIPPSNFHEVLKICFDGLGEQEKRIFLNIACFLVGNEMSKENITDRLKNCGFNGAETSITILTARSLIKVTHNNTLWIHDQLRDMGSEIYQEGWLGDTFIPSRLRDEDEIAIVSKYEKIAIIREQVYIQGISSSTLKRAAESFHVLEELPKYESTKWPCNHTFYDAAKNAINSSSNPGDLSYTILTSTH